MGDDRAQMQAWRKRYAPTNKAGNIGNSDYDNGPKTCLRGSWRMPKSTEFAHAVEVDNGVRRTSTLRLSLCGRPTTTNIRRSPETRARGGRRSNFNLEPTHWPTRFSRTVTPHEAPTRIRLATCCHRRRVPGWRLVLLMTWLVTR